MGTPPAPPLPKGKTHMWIEYNNPIMPPTEPPQQKPETPLPPPAGNFKMPPVPNVVPRNRQVKT